jgi:hypothetical protein
VSVDGIPQNVVQFLAEHIDSVVQVEVLLLLHSHPGVEWPAERLAQELRINPDWAAAALAQLESLGILEASPGGFRYAPRTAEIAHTITSVSKAYEDRRVSVISLIFSKPPDPIRQFTDAFRFRKEQGS